MRKSIAAAVGLFFCLMVSDGLAATGGKYDVLYPIGKQMSEIKNVAPSLPDLNGKTVCELWNYLFRGDETFKVMREMLKEKYPDIKVIPYTEFGNTHGPDEAKMIAALPAKLKELGCDAVISGNGG